MSEQNQKSPKRYAYLLFILAILSLYQILFAFRVLIDRGLYGDNLSLSPVIQAGMALLWAILFLIAVLGLARGKRFGLGYSAWLIISFVVYNVLRVILFAQADYERNRIPFLVMGAIMILIIPVLVLLRRDNQSAEQ
jgi:putative exporter of polyketide antibiotics